MKIKILRSRKKSNWCGHEEWMRVLKALENTDVVLREIPIDDSRINGIKNRTKVYIRKAGIARRIKKRLETGKIRVFNIPSSSFMVNCPKDFLKNGKVFLALSGTKEIEAALNDLRI